MTAKHKRKSRRYRGSNTHGCGSHKKRRGSGNRGGFGNAGTGKRADQKKFTVLKKYGSSYFGKFGFKRKNTVEIRAVNIGDLPATPKINIKDLGYNKLLGKGIPKVNYDLIVDFCSRKAREKIEKSGGKVKAIIPMPEEKISDVHENI